MGQPTILDVTIPHPQPNPNAKVQPHQSKNPTTHALTHARPSLPINPSPILTPPTQAPSALHDTAAALPTELSWLDDLKILSQSNLQDSIWLPVIIKKQNENVL